MPAKLMRVCADLQQALESTAKQTEQAERLEVELEECKQDNTRLCASVAGLESKCSRLQVGS